ncbi:amino acid adenylation domain-containing protein [Streptomyces sp. NPDC050504]|uniref:amino acid adenylation domain-containing protein n=1 Tax=Streptomyces sp. NPDC050504 TaxID=3365618 RepID=UPI0037B72024
MTQHQGRPGPDTPPDPGRAAAARALLDQRVSAARRRAAEGGAAASGVPRRPEGARTASYTQERMWLVEHLSEGSALYNVHEVFRLRGPLDTAALGHAFSDLVRRHEVLRTVFTERDGRPEPSVSPAEPCEPALVDLRAAPGADTVEEHGEDTGEEHGEGTGESRVEDRVRRALALAHDEIRRPFDLTRAPLLRATLIRIDEDDHLLVVVVHHIAVDGWSMPLLWNDLSAMYLSRTGGREHELPAQTIQYADFAHWQRDRLAGERLREQLDHWRERLADVATLDLPTDRPRGPVRSGRGERVTFAFPDELVDRLRLVGQRHGTTLFMTLLAGFQALLARYSGQHDVAVGTPVAGRSRPELEGLVGAFINTVVVRTDLSGDPGFAELLGRVRRTAVDAYAHQDVPFERLVQELRPDRGADRNPLFQVLFAGLSGDAARPRLPGVEVEQVELDNGTAKVDLSLVVAERPSGTTGTFAFDRDLFDRPTVRRLVGHYLRLLDSAANDPGLPLSRLELLTGAEHEDLREAAGEAEPVPSELCLHELVEHHARHTPEAPAVHCGDRRLTYGELDRRANRLARHLRDRGAGPECLVGVCLPRSVDLVVALLAVLKAGAAYLPLDPELPERRLAFMLADARVPLLVTERSLADRLPRSGADVVWTDTEAERIAAWPDEPLPPLAVPANLAYSIYTSGSTGRPKAVLVPHEGVVNYLVVRGRQLGLDRTDVVASVASISFDVLVPQVFMPLARGASVVIAPSEVAVDGPRLADMLRRFDVTTLMATPATWLLLLDSGWRGGRFQAICVGEALQPRLARRLLGVVSTLWNGYGPTEASVGAVTHRVDAERDLDGPGASVPIGRPLGNLRVHLLDRAGNPVPVGVPGEIHIGGVGVTRGYAGRPGLTAERFVPDPYGSGGRLYRTGDLARYLPDGSLVFLGRTDEQVKVRGYRIELGEIEAALCALPGVTRAVVTVRGTGADAELAGYVVRQDAGGDPDVLRQDAGENPDAHRQDVGGDLAALRQALRESLPEFMVPATLTALDRLPLTTNGKVDRGALPAPARRDPAAPVLPPRDVLELRMARIWQRVLGSAEVGVRDNFFDLGGHSLRAVRLMEEIDRELGVRVPLNTVFRHPTVEALCAELPAAPAALRRLLVPLVEGGAGRAPLFLVHPQSGGVAGYLPLTRLIGTDRPVFGIEAVGYGTDEEPLGTVEEQAERYLREMRKVAPEGPYLLMGWSFGGLVAFEVARMLEEAGEAPAFLGIIDAGAPGAPRGDGAGDGAGNGRAPFRIGAGPGELPAPERSELLGRMERVFAANGEAGSRYLSTAVLRTPVHLFVSTDVHPTRRTPKVRPALWQRHTDGGLSVFDVPGNHFDMLSDPYVDTFAKTLSSVLSPFRRVAT